MTTGAAYDLAQTMGWKHGLSARPMDAKKWVTVGVNFVGLNPMKVFGLFRNCAGIFLMLLIMLMTNKRAIMGDQVNSAAMNVLGWPTTGSIFAATAGLIINWIYLKFGNRPMNPNCGLSTSQSYGTGFTQRSLYS